MCFILAGRWSRRWRSSPRVVVQRGLSRDPDPTPAKVTRALRDLKARAAMDCTEYSIVAYLARNERLDGTGQGRREDFVRRVGGSSDKGGGLVLREGP